MFPNYFNKLMDYLQIRFICVIDFETYWDNEYSLTKMPTEQYINHELFCEHIMAIVIYDRQTGKLSKKVFHKLVLPQIIEHIPWHITFLAAHNAIFDAGIVSFKYDKIPKLVFCTQSMARPLVNGFRVALGAVVEEFNLGHKGETELAPTKGKQTHELTPQEFNNLVSYCLNDASLTFDLLLYELQYINTKAILFMDIVLKMFIDPFFDGDINIFKTLKDNLEKEKRESLLSLDLSNDLEEVKTALRSRDTFAHILHRLGVPIPYKLNKKGTATYAFAKTDAGMQELLNSENQRIAAITAAKLGLASTNEETKAKRFLAMAQNGKLCVPLKIYGAHTGRLSSLDKMGWQNINKKSDLRKGIVAPPGYVIVARDSSQIQARLTAWFCQCEYFTRLFRENDLGGPDVYCSFGTEYIYRELITKKDVDKRFISKQAVLGLGFYMGWSTFKNTVESLARQYGVTLPQDIPDEFYKNAVWAFRKAAPEIKTMWEWAIEMLKSVVYEQVYTDGRHNIIQSVPKVGLSLPNGLHLRYRDIRINDDGSVYYRTPNGKPESTHGGKVLENIIQALEQVLIQHWMVRLHYEFGYKVALQEHDAIICGVSERQADECLENMRLVMCTPMNWCKDLPLNSEGGYHRNYGELVKS